MPTSENFSANKKGFAPILIVILLTAAVGGFLIYTNLPAGRQGSSNSQTKPNPSPTTQSSFLDEAEDWKTYTNTEYKYTLKYPPDWTVEAQDNSDVNTFPAPLFNSPCDYDKGELCPQIFIRVLADTSGSNFSVGSAGETSNKVMIELDGEDAEGFEYFDPNYGGGDNQGRLQYVLTTNHNNTAFTFTYEESQKDKAIMSASDWQKREVFDQVISTFKFE